MQSLELKIPPPAVALLVALLMWFTSRFMQPLNVPFDVRVSLALLLVVIGQAISISGMVAFRRAKTTVNPMKASAASSLVSNGIYRFTRNPMYVGLSLTLVAWTVFLAQPVALLWVAIFVVYIQRFQIVPEEKALSSLFGTDFAEYQKKVRRWI
jgi:protein-S-isoprenylcysteine O-methyltransferase Ste14